MAEENTVEGEVEQEKTAEQAPAESAPSAAQDSTRKELMKVATDVRLSAKSWEVQSEFRYLYQVAQIYAASDSVPSHFRNKPNDVAIVLQMAARRGLDPFIMMQNLYTTGGKMGMQAPYAMSLATESGVFRGRIRFTTHDSGKLLELPPESPQKLRDMSVTAQATMADTGEIVDATVSMLMAYGEGWTTRGTKNPNKMSKYETMPEQMLRYRAAMFLLRTFAPEVIFGMQSREELEDIQGDAIEAHTVPSGGGPSTRLSQRLAT